MKKEKNEELQSRREFFKKAAKTALPFVAAVALVSNPIVAKAVEAPMGCNSGCISTCSGTCKGTCQTGCSTTCYNQCYNACKNTCKGTCRGTCSGCTGY